MIIIKRRDGGLVQYTPQTQQLITVSASKKQTHQDGVASAPTVAHSVLAPAGRVNVQALVSDSGKAFTANGATAVSSSVFKATGTRQIKYDDGRVMNERKGGLQIAKFPSGRVLQMSSGGTLIEAFGDGRASCELRKDGAWWKKRERERERERETVRSTSPVACTHISSLLLPSFSTLTGTRVVILPSGARTTYLPSGVSVAVDDAGGKIQTNANGTRIKSFVGGRTVQENRDGTIIETLADKTTRIFRPDGRGSITAPGGKAENFGPGKFRASIEGLLEMH